MKLSSPRATLALVGLLLLEPDSLAHMRFSVSVDDAMVRNIGLSGYTLSESPITVSGDTVLYGLTFAFRPSDRMVFAVLKLVSNGPNECTLVRMEVWSGATEVIGVLPDTFAAISIDDSGQMWGITADTALVPESLYDIDTVSAIATFRLSLATGTPGEAMGFDLQTGQLYHASGSWASGPTFERIDPVTLVRTPIPLSGDAWGDLHCMSWDEHDYLFNMTGGSGAMSGRDHYRVSTSGVVTRQSLIVPFDHKVSSWVGLICDVNCGDCDRSGGDATITDALLVAQLAVQLQFPSGWHSVCCDARTIGRWGVGLNALDALRIAQSAVGLIDPLRVCLP